MTCEKMEDQIKFLSFKLLKRNITNVHGKLELV